MRTPDYEEEEVAVAVAAAAAAVAAGVPAAPCLLCNSVHSLAAAAA